MPFFFLKFQKRNLQFNFSAYLNRSRNRCMERIKDKWLTIKSPYYKTNCLLPNFLDEKGYPGRNCPLPLRRGGTFKCTLNLITGLKIKWKCLVRRIPGTYRKGEFNNWIRKFLVVHRLLPGGYYLLAANKRTGVWGHLSGHWETILYGRVSNCRYWRLFPLPVYLYG